MRILIIGGGLMGPAAAYNAFTDPDVSQVGICDRDREQLDACMGRLKTIPGADKLTAIQLDLAERDAIVEMMHEYDAAVAALPRPANRLAIEAALETTLPLVDLARPHDHWVPELHRRAERTGGLIVLGCGVEPGLTEIMTRYLAEMMDRVEEVHIKCGGIPEKPEPPLGYKIVFGGREMPLWEADALVVRDGELVPVPRYSEAEVVSFPMVGECEAWHEGFMPWLLDLAVLQGLRLGTQKTIRWPGYAAKVTVLKEIGLLSTEPVLVDGVSVQPKQLLDAVLYPHVRLEEGERDLTLFRVEVLGEKDGRPCRYQAEMVDRFDVQLGFTSMARTTSYTGAMVARMIARGEISATGALPPEQIVTGPHLERLLSELAAADIHFKITH